MALERELALFRAQLPDLLGFGYAGQWAVIGKRFDEPGDTPVRLVTIEPTWEAGLGAGYEAFGPGPFLVKQVLEKEPVIWMRGWL